ncbi:MAG: response regulator [Candidatus Wallbacteria bacterium]|nr:response regulator [Candidatus Wallbacteria bacterium]
MKRRIMVVDDEQPILMGMQDLLRIGGHEVETFSNPLQAVARLQLEEFDCVITDMLMPELDGLEVVKAVRLRWPDSAIIVITGKPDLSTAVEALHQGASDYLVKPVFDNDIERVIERVIERAGLLKSLRQRNAELELLLEASSTLSQATREDEVARKLNALMAPSARAISAGARKTLQNIADEVIVKLRASRFREQAKLGALLEAQPAGIVFLDERGEPAIVSKRARELLGLADPLPGGPCASLPPELVNNIRGGSCSRSPAELRVTAKPGCLLQIRCAPVFDRDLRLGTVATVLDVTDERENEMQMQIASRLATLGILLGGLSHEMNNPLAIIMGCAEELAAEPDSPSTQKAHRILDAADRCTKLIRRFIQVANPAVNRSGMVDLHSLVSSTLEMLRVHLHESQIRLHAQTKIVPRIRGNAGELKDALLALFLNAVESMSPGGELRVRLWPQPGGDVQLEVADTGHGMTPEVERRIFDPFFTTKPPGQGVGLGLTLVHSICRRMNARIFVASSPKAGTTFRIQFPTVTESGVSTDSAVTTE